MYLPPSPVAVFSLALAPLCPMRYKIEAKIVVVGDHMSSIVWRIWLLENLGYKVEDSLIYQDNQSAMIMKTNGK